MKPHLIIGEAIGSMEPRPARLVWVWVLAFALVFADMPSENLRAACPSMFPANFFDARTNGLDSGDDRNACAECNVECMDYWQLECNQECDHPACHGLCQLGYEKCVAQCERKACET
jgi:hypothetical protein